MHPEQLEGTGKYGANNAKLISDWALMALEEIFETNSKTQRHSTVKSELNLQQD